MRDVQRGRRWNTSGRGECADSAGWLVREPRQSDLTLPTRYGRGAWPTRPPATRARKIPAEDSTAVPTSTTTPCSCTVEPAPTATFRLFGSGVPGRVRTVRGEQSRPPLAAWIIRSSPQPALARLERRKPTTSTASGSSEQYTASRVAYRGGSCEEIVKKPSRSLGSLPRREKRGPDRQTGLYGPRKPVSRKTVGADEPPSRWILSTKAAGCRAPPARP